jgi:hypothetical protein
MTLKQPTAYDEDKVIEHLENEKQILSECALCNQLILTKELIGLLKSSSLAALRMKNNFSERKCKWLIAKFVGNIVQTITNIVKSVHCLLKESG